MEALLVLLALYLFAVLVVLPIWTLINVGRNTDQTEVLRGRVSTLENEVNLLRTALKNLPAAPAPAPTPEAPAAFTPTVVAAAAATPPSIATPLTAPAIPEATEPPPLPDQPTQLGGLPVFTVAAAAPVPVAFEDDAPPPIIPPLHIAAAAPPPPPPPVYTPPPPTPSWTDSINWEQFMGAKLFAWLGGLALFLGVAYFVKFSIDQGWISNELRVAIGFVFGAGLVVGGLKIPRVKYAITAQTLIAAGIVSLYAVTVMCGKDHYHFLETGPMFLLMALITTTAFVLAVRLEAQVVAILGILGGFLTPWLLSTGVDNPGGLFGYLALLDIGLVAVALHRQWFYLVPLGATGTVIMMVGWAGRFYAPEKTTTAMTICLGFCALFIGAAEVARRLGRDSRLLAQSAIALPAVAFCFAWFFLGGPAAAARTELFFGFVLLISLGVFFLAWREALGGLVAGAGAVSAVLMVRWAANTFSAEQTPVVVAVCLGFSVLYFIVYLLARRFGRASPSVLWSAVGLPAVALGFAYFLMAHPEVGARPGLMFSFILVSDGLLLALAWLDDRLSRLHLLAGLVVFALLSFWTAEHLSDDLLPWALAAYLAFAALHTVFPLLLERHRPAASPTWWSQLFPPLTLLLMLFPIYRLESVSFLIWPAILLVDVLAIVLAVLSASLAAVGAVLVLTLLATGLCLFRVPVDLGFSPGLLIVIGGFATFFFAASLWLARKLGDQLPAGDQKFASVFGDARAQLPAFASLLPFLLLIMACARLAVPDPSAVFGLGLLLVVLTLGLARLLVIEWLPVCALAGVAALQYAWHARHFNPADAGLPLVWHVAFYAVFAAYPFVFRRDFSRLTGPWAVAALSGVGHFWVVYQTIKAGWPGSADVLGAVPAMFVLAPLGSLVAVLRAEPADNPKRLNQLAWFGAVALFFVTLIFPIQFERQWLTVAWALEGAALLWLFHRVPHPGLQAVGAILLFTASVRLTLNPAVLKYHVRGDIPILNWYLYAYGLVSASSFIGAYLMAPPRARVIGIDAPPFFNSQGTVLAFILLNIEITDYFTAPGARSLAFQFSGNFARDMSYTIGWALFALALLGAGIWKLSRKTRYAAIVLLSIALLKLFVHDLFHIETIYKIGALMAVAVIAILASFAYQRFLPSNEKNPPPQP
jgi:uncharacterized membrane protein